MQMSRRSGFSMMEVVGTMVVVGVLAGIAIPRMDFSRMRSDAALRQLTLLCVQAQRTALMKQYNVILSVDQATSRIRLVEDRNNSDTFDTGDRVTWMSMESGVVFREAPTALDGFSAKVSFTNPKNLNGMISVIFRRNRSEERRVGKEC